LKKLPDNTWKMVHYWHTVIRQSLCFKRKELFNQMLHLMTRPYVGTLCCTVSHMASTRSRFEDFRNKGWKNKLLSQLTPLGMVSPFVLRVGYKRHFYVLTISLFLL